MGPYGAIIWKQVWAVAVGALEKSFQENSILGKTSARTIGHYRKYPNRPHIGDRIGGYRV